MEKNDKCVVAVCPNKKSTCPNMKFFDFPADIQSVSMWLDGIDRDDLMLEEAKDYQICEKHFVPTKIVDGVLAVDAYPMLPEMLKASLKYNQPGYVPEFDFFLYTEEDDKNERIEDEIERRVETDVQIYDEFSQESDDEDFGSDDEYGRFGDSFESDSDDDDDYMGPIGNFLTSQMNSYLKKKKFPGNIRRKLDQQLAVSRTLKSDSINLHELAFKVFFAAQKKYVHIQSTMLSTLPEVMDLVQSPKKWQFKAGATDLVYKALALKTEYFKDEEKHCLIMAHEENVIRSMMYIIAEDKMDGFCNNAGGETKNEAAENGIILTAVGLSANWRHVLGYLLVNKKDPECVGDVKKFIFKSIINLKLLGIKCHGLISSLGEVLIKFANEMDISVNKSHFNIGNDQIYFMYDPICLVVEMRDSLIENDFHPDETGDKFTWEMYKEIPKVIKDKKLKVNHPFTRDHFDKTKFYRMSYGKALEMFSKNVSCLIRNLSLRNAVPDVFKKLAKFGELVDDVKDECCSFLYSGQHNASSDFSKISTFKAMGTVMKKLRIVNKNGEDVTKLSKFRIGWRITLKSVLQLISDFTGNLTYCYPGSTLQGVSMVGTWCHLATHDEGCDTITPFAIRKSVRDDFQESFTMCWNSDATTPKSDLLNAITIVIDHQLKEKSPFQECLEQEPLERIQICEKDNKNNIKIKGILFKFNTCKKHVGKIFDQLCNFLYKIGLKHHNGSKCDECSTVLNENTVMSKNFIDFIDQLDTEFVKQFPKYVMGEKVGHNILTHLQEIRPENNCPLLPLEFLIKVFLRARISVTTKMVTRFLLENKQQNKLADFEYKKLSDIP